MNANQMAYELELKADRLASFGSPGYEDQDITSVLTEAEVLYVKKFVDEKNNRKSEGLDETEIRNQGLSALIKRGAGLLVSTSQTGTITNGTFYDLPFDFMYTIHESAIIDKTICGKEGGVFIDATVYPIGYGEVSRFKNNKYKRPYASSGESKVWRLVYSRESDGFNSSIPITQKRHELVTDGTFNVTDYSINYLQLPKGIIVDRDINGARGIFLKHLTRVA